jgi:hypothetical protein
VIASMAFFLSRKSSAGVFWNVLGNSLPESAQGFLTFVRVEYYDAPTILPDVLFNFASNILKTS